MGLEKLAVYDITQFNDAFRRFGERVKLQGANASAKLDDVEFKVVYERYKVQILSYCYDMTGNQQEAQEVAQEVFFKVWKSKWKYLPDGPLVYRIAYNACCDLLRNRHHVEILYLDDAGGGLVSNIADPEEEALRTERKRELAQAILRLPEAYRSVILLAYRGFTNRQIAEILGKNEGTVKNYRHLAYVMLRQWLDIGG
jgi:RNA polymerase sigma-70 factor (ECF subfamily)